MCPVLQPSRPHTPVHCLQALRTGTTCFLPLAPTHTLPCHCLQVLWAMVGTTTASRLKPSSHMCQASRCCCWPSCCRLLLPLLPPAAAGAATSAAAAAACWRCCCCHWGLRGWERCAPRPVPATAQCCQRALLPGQLRVDRLPAGLHALPPSLQVVMPSGPREAKGECCRVCAEGFHMHGGVKWQWCCGVGNSTNDPSRVRCCRAAAGVYPRPKPRCVLRGQDAVQNRWVHTGQEGS